MTTTELLARLERRIVATLEKLEKRIADLEEALDPNECEACGGSGVVMAIDSFGDPDPRPCRDCEGD